MANDVMKTEQGNFVVEWRDRFKTGVAQIDDENRHLFSLVKALSLDSIHAMLNELLVYFVAHFSHEQELMESSGFPDFRQHVVLHETFSPQLAEFQSASSEWSEGRIQELRKFLNKWLIGHILTHDLRFGRWYLQDVRKAVAQTAKLAASKPKVGWFDRFLGRS